MQILFITPFFILAHHMHEEDKKFFTRIQSDLSEINKSLMNLSGMGRDLDITKENIKNLASLVVINLVFRFETFGAVFSTQIPCNSVQSPIFRTKF